MLSEAVESFVQYNSYKGAIANFMYISLHLVRMGFKCIFCGFYSMDVDSVSRSKHLLRF